MLHILVHTTYLYFQYFLFLNIQTEPKLSLSRYIVFQKIHSIPTCLRKYPYFLYNECFFSQLHWRQSIYLYARCPLGQTLLLSCKNILCMSEASMKMLNKRYVCLYFCTIKCSFIRDVTNRFFHEPNEHETSKQSHELSWASWFSPQASIYEHYNMYFNFHSF